MNDTTRSDDANFAERRARLDRQIAAGRAAREILELHRQGEPGLRERSLALLSECADTDTAPPPELVQLIGELLRPEQRGEIPAGEWREAGLTPPRTADPVGENDAYRRTRAAGVKSVERLAAWRRAVQAEADEAPDPKGKAPSALSAEKVADVASANLAPGRPMIDEKTIQRWRRQHRYRRLVEKLRRRRLGLSE